MVIIAPKTFSVVDGGRSQLEQIRILRVQHGSGSEVSNIGALIISNTLVGVPYYNYSMMGPETVLRLLRPLY